MRTSSIVILLALILLPAILRYPDFTFNRIQWLHVQDMQGKDLEFEGGFRHPLRTGAIVISKKSGSRNNTANFSNWILGKTLGF